MAHPFRPEASQVIRRDQLPAQRRPQPRHKPMARRPSTPPTGREPRRKIRWGKHLRRFLVLAATITLVAGCCLVATGLWIDGRLNRVEALVEYADRPAPSPGDTWLLVGSDSRQGLTIEQETELATGGDTGNGRTDTILLVHVPAFYDNGPTTMISIPRDSYVPIPGNGSDKINAAFAIGGAPLLTQTLERATGLRIDHYGEIGFGGFAKVVDAVGGVDMCLDAPVDDPLAGIDLPAGCQELNGPNALGYVRSRATARADLDRMTHQRQFMAALLARVSGPGVAMNPLRWYPLASAAADSLTVDTGAHVWDLARLAWALKGSVQNLTMPLGSFTQNTSGDVVIWDSDAAHRLFSALRNDDPIPPDLLPETAPTAR